MTVLSDAENREVERAAFGPDAPDAEVEDRIREQEPAWRGVDDSSR